MTRRIDRRTMVAGMTLAALAPGRARSAAGRARVALIAGGYRSLGNPGLTPVDYDPGSGAWTPQPAVTDAPNASFAIPGARPGILYAVEEGAEGWIAVLRRGRDGGWARAARLSSRGADPCHLALHPTGRLLAVANYTGGGVTMFRLDQATGLPLGEGEARAHRGSGPNADRQTGPHAHWVGFTPDGRWLHAVDLGADAVFAWRADPETGALGDTQVAYRGEPGAGPRHLARHPRLPRAYLINELANTITVLRVAGPAALERIATVSSLPAGFSGKSSAAEIAVNRAGTRLYASNRGHDSIAVFAIDRDGGLELIAHTPCGGRAPRHFLLMDAERRLLVANQGAAASPHSASSATAA